MERKDFFKKVVAATPAYQHKICAGCSIEDTQYIWVKNSGVSICIDFEGRINSFSVGDDREGEKLGKILYKNFGPLPYREDFAGKVHRGRLNERGDID